MTPALTTRKMIPEFVETEVEIVEVLTERTSKSKLPNGRIILTFFDEAAEPKPLEIGQQATVRLNLADFTRGMIVAVGARTSESAAG